MSSEIIYIFNFGAVEESYAEVVNYIDNKRFGMMQQINVEKMGQFNVHQISDKNVCVMILTENAVSDQMTNNKLQEIWNYINKEHIPVLPLAAGSQSYIDKLPKGLPSLHILNLQDPCLMEKVCRFFIVKPSASNIKKDIHYVVSCWGNGSVYSCTLGQLFNYALGLFYGIVVEKDLKRAVTLLTCLIGNDAFEPDMIYFDSTARAGITGEIFDFSNELKKYLDSQLSNIVTTQDYRQAEELIDYANLLRRAGKKLYGWNMDDSLRKLRDVVLPLFEKDHSLKVGKWLIDYYWERSIREADGRYYRKALDCIFEIILIGERIEQKYHDSFVQRTLFKCYSTLYYYLENNRRKAQDLIEYKVTDEIEDDGTFRPPYREIKRNKEDCKFLLHLVMNSKQQYIHKIDEIFENSGDDFQQYEDLLSALLDAGYMSILFKANTIATTTSEWFISSSDYMRSKINDYSFEYQLKLLKTISDFLAMLQQRYIARTNLENLFKLAEYLEYIFDMNQPKFIEMGLDKSEIYVIYMEYYSEKKKLKKYDDYAMKLYKIVAKRDHENLEMMERLLADIYNVAVERMDMHKYPQMCEYIALGWDICQTFNSIPNCLQEAYEAFRSAASNLEMI